MLRHDLRAAAAAAGGRGQQEEVVATHFLQMLPAEVAAERLEGKVEPADANSSCFRPTQRV